MTIKELADSLYSKIQKDPELAELEIRSVQLDPAATKNNIIIDKNKGYADISNGKLF